MLGSRFRELGKRFAYHTFDLARLEHLFAQRGVGQVLSLHRVHPDPSPYWPPIHPDQLDWLISRLKRLGTFVEIGELSSTRVHAHARIFALTFDDGYADFVEYGLPVLASHNVPSNLNVVAESAMTGHPIWSSRLYQALAQVEGDPLEILEDLLPEIRAGSLSGPPDHVGFAVSNQLRLRPRNERIAVVEALERATESDSGPLKALTVEQIQALPQSVHVGAHGGTHEPMSDVSMDEFNEDFAMCRELFDTQLGLSLTTYAFPLGGYRSEQVDFLLDEGLEQILVVDEKTTLGGTRVLPRLTVGGTLRGQFIAKSVGATGGFFSD